jgi:hypothetical protein
MRFRYWRTDWYGAGGGETREKRETAHENALSKPAGAGGPGWQGYEANPQGLSREDHAES